MDYMTKTKELLTQYEVVCRKQRESAVRNSALLQDVDRIQHLLTQTKPQRQLQALKSRYQQYIASVYPQWLGQLKSCVKSTESSLSSTTTEATSTPSKVDSAGLHKPMYSTATDTLLKPHNVPVSTVAVKPSTVESPTSGGATKTTTADTSVPIPTTSEMQQLSKHDVLTAHPNTAADILTTSVSTPCVAALTTHMVPIVTCSETIATCSATTATHVGSINTSVSTHGRTEGTLAEPVVFSSAPATRQPDSLIASTSPPVDKSLDLTLSTYSVSTEDSVRNVSTMKEPLIDVPSPAGTTPSHHLVECSNSPSNTPSLAHSPTPSKHNSPAVSLNSPTLSKQDSCAPSEHHSPSLSLSNSPIGTPLQHHSSTSTASQQQSPASTPSQQHSPASTPSQHHSPATTPSPPPFTKQSSPSAIPTPSLSPTVAQPPIVSTPSPAHPPPAPVRTSSLTPSPAHPPATPVRTSSLPPLTPSPAHSLSQDSLPESFCPDRVKVATNLLKTLNDHLRAEREVVAMEMYSEPEDSDKMKLKISSSNVLSTNIIKAADSGLDCSTWDPSVVCVVLLHQLALLSVSQRSAIPNELLTEDAPIISEPFEVSPAWSQVWTVFMEHVQLLHCYQRPLDELAAIFTPALVTTSTEKACLHLLAHFKLTMESNRASSPQNQQDEISEGRSQQPMSQEGDVTVSEDLSEESVSLPILSDPVPGQERRDGLLDYSTLGGGGDLSEHSSLLSEGSAVMRLERELKTDDHMQLTSQTKDHTQLVSQQTTPSGSDESSVATTPGYVPTAMENSVPLGPSQLSNNSSLRRRLGFFDDSDSDLEEASDVLSPRQPALEEDFDFYG